MGSFIDMKKGCLFFQWNGNRDSLTYKIKNLELADFV